MKFYTLYADIDEEAAFSEKEKHNSIKKIAISEFVDGELTFTKSWDVEKSSNGQRQLGKKYLNEVFQEINPIIFNSSVVIFDANFTVSLIFLTYKYLANKSEKIDGEQKTKILFPGLAKELRNIKFDYVCLSLLYRRLFFEIPSIKLSELCDECCPIQDKTAENYSKAVGELFLKIGKIADVDNMTDLKHLAGVTLGQATNNSAIADFLSGVEYKRRKNTGTEVEKKDRKKTDIEVEEENKLLNNKIICYTPCVPITGDTSFRKFDFASVRK